MLNLLSQIGEVIVSLVNLLVTTITSLVSLITNIPSYITFLTNSLNILPSFLLPWALAFISLIVVQYILNRKGL